MHHVFRNRTRKSYMKNEFSKGYKGLEFCILVHDEYCFPRPLVTAVGCNEKLGPNVVVTHS